MIFIATTTRRAGHCIDSDRPDVFVHREEENPGHGPFRGHDVPSDCTPSATTENGETRPDKDLRSVSPCTPDVWGITP